MNSLAVRGWVKALISQLIDIIPTKVGIYVYTWGQNLVEVRWNLPLWIPAFAGMTKEYGHDKIYAIDAFFRRVICVNRDVYLSKKGFTLIELLLVTVIMVIAAAAVVPNFSRTAMRLELKKTAEDIAYTIRFGQLRAMTKGRLLRLNMDTRGYWLEEDRASQDDDVSASVRPIFEQVKSSWGRRTDFPKGIKLLDSEKFIIISPNGRMAPVNLRLCRDEKCLMISTTKQYGRVSVLDQQKTDVNALL